ncbi:DinB family protein [Chloroflexota bacterium]
MRWQQLIMDLFQRISRELEVVLGGLTVDDLNQRPGSDCNSIGWLAWHLTRSHDRNMTELMVEEQLWIRDRWYAKFNLTPNPAETGFKHSAEEVTTFRSPDSNTLMAYHRAVLKRIEIYINNALSEEELERETYSATLHISGLVEARLVGVINDSMQHVGQAAYLRGLLKGKGWLDR